MSNSIDLSGLTSEEQIAVVKTLIKTGAIL